MTLISLFDIISSVFISLGTIMMPSDNIYKFEGPMLGNKVTCQIQGWLTTFGFTGTTASNACLAWYFVCIIAFKMSSRTYATRIEPLMYVYVLFLAAFIPSFYLSLDLLNPHGGDSFCTIVPYAVNCDDSEKYRWDECEWGDKDEEDFYRYARLAVYDLTLQFVLIVVGMSIILWTVFRNRKELKILIENESNTHGNEALDNHDDDETPLPQHRIQLLRDLKYSRVLIVQALMYIAAYLLTWMMNFLSFQFSISIFASELINAILFPIQGFWNLLIFLYDKSYLIRQSDGSISFLEAARQIISSPMDIPTMLLSDISFLNVETKDHVSVEGERVHGLEPILDYAMSEIASEFDGLSELRDPQMSVADSSSSSSEKVFSISGVLSIDEASRKNYVKTHESER
jgi:hypothetical protein